MQYFKQLFVTGSAFAILLTGFGFSLPLTAQTMEEVTVQAEFQEDEALDDLVSASVMDSEKLADAGIGNVEDVAAYVPNLVLTQTETGTSIVIRGIGAGVNQGFDQSVGLYIDRVPLPRANMSRAPFLDLQNIQVLRGPQYVKDGNYSIAGSIHMLSNLSLDEFGAGIDLNYIPSQNDQKLVFTAGMPFNDVFAGRVAIQSRRSDGYIENVTRDEDGPQNEELIARIVFGFNPTDDLSFKFKVEHGSFDTTGRAAEIILDEKAPTPPHPPTGPGFKFASDYHDFSATPDNIAAHKRMNALGIPYNANSIYGGPPDSATGQFWYGGKSYLELLSSLYNGTYSNIPYSEVIANRQGTFPTGAYPVVPEPAGLRDATLNFKRGADAEEFSNNESLNITLNTDLWLGDHKVLLTSSWVEYQFDEQIDSDFTAAPILVSRQFEEYEQIFQRIDYESPEGAFIQVKAGGSYLDSKLLFTDVTNLGLTPSDPNASSADRFLLLPKQPGGQFSTTPEPLRMIFGGANRRGLTSLEAFSFDRIFEQDAETYAAYIETTVNWSESFRTILGARYTHSEKTALRDLAFLDSNGEGPSPLLLGPLERREMFSFLGQTLGIHMHTDRVDPDVDNISWLSNGANPSLRARQCTGPDNKLCAIRGTRKEETLLPSIAFEWDINDDLSAFVSIRKANKLGGFDARANTVPDVRPNTGLPGGTFEFFDENATTYETGLKWYLPGGWGEVNTTAFLTKYEDLQVSRFDGKSGFNVANASAATTQGIEIEGLLTVTDQFNMQYSMAWIDFTFDDFLFGSCHLGRAPDHFVLVGQIEGLSFPLRGPDGNEIGEATEVGEIIPILYDYDRPNPDTVLLEWRGESTSHFANDYDNNMIGAPGLCDFDGQSNQFVAEWQGTFTFNYETEIIGVGLLKPTLDVLYNSGYLTSASQDPLSAQDEFVQFNGRIALVSFEDTWTVALTGQNLTNEKIISYSNETPLGARLQGARGFVGFVRPPRSIGINLRYKFY